MPQVITPFNVYFNAHLIFKKGEVWRLFTNFFFFGNLGEQCLSKYGSAAAMHVLAQHCSWCCLQLVLPATTLLSASCVYMCVYACAQGWTLCFTCFSL